MTDPQPDAQQPSEQQSNSQQSSDQQLPRSAQQLPKNYLHDDYQPTPDLELTSQDQSGSTEPVRSTVQMDPDGQQWDLDPDGEQQDLTHQPAVAGQQVPAGQLVQQTTRPKTRWRIVGGMALAAVGLTVAFTVPVPYVVVSPGPVINTLGEYRSTPIIDITGTQTYPTSGSLDMTTVRERGGPYGPLTAVEAVIAYVNDRAVVLPRELMFPKDESGAQSRQRSASDFTSAQRNAVAAAVNYLGIPAEEQVVIVGVLPDGPAAGKLAVDDVIVQVNGEPVADTQQAVDRIRAAGPHVNVELLIRRDEAEQQVEVTTRENPENPQWGSIGVSIGDEVVPPFDVEFAVDGIGGPSAGLIFTLAIIDELTPEQINGGLEIAGTGTINPAGEVGRIGGIRQKMLASAQAGATLFLAPKDNCEQVVGYVPAGLTIAAVGTVEEAIAAMKAHAAGQTPVGCESGDQIVAE